MTASDSTRGSQAAYDFWLGLIPQFLGQFGGTVPGVGAQGGPSPAGMSDALRGLMFPADQIAKAAMLTQHSLQGMAQSLAPLLQTGGLPNLLAQWAAAAPAFTAGKPADTGTAAAAAGQAMLAPWTALMSGMAGAVPASASAFGAAASPTSPLQALSQAWIDMGSKLAGATPAQVDAAFERTYAALGDALGFSPARNLQGAWREVLAASAAHQEARTSYALLVQEAFTQGFQRLLAALAQKADAGERIDSILALIRLWALKTEEAVHEIFQSERGLAATTALMRSAVTYRKKMQQAAAVVADIFDMATRRELDDAYREIQALKREIRASRPSGGTERVASKSKGRSVGPAGAAKRKTAKGNRAASDQADA